MSGRSKGLEHVESLEGSEASRRRLRLVLETIAGERTVESACVDLGISAARFAELRKEALAGALSALEPKPLGRPAAPPPDAEVERLKAENFELKRDLEAARIREELAIVMPHVLRPPKAGEKGGPGGKRGGRAGT
jgi:hypothetical protein